MSYRIEVNGVQLFGNNEAPKAFMDFLRKSGVKTDEDSNFDHTFETGTLDVMGAIGAIEQSIEDMDEIRHRSAFPQDSLWDFSKQEAIIKRAKEENDPTLANISDCAMQLYNSAYIFMPVVFVHTLLKDGCIRPIRPYADGKHLYCYVQTDKIHIKGN